MIICSSQCISNAALCLSVKENVMKQVIFITLLTIISACTPLAESTLEASPVATIDSLPTPSREGQVSGNTDEIVGDPGSGFGLNVLGENQSENGFVAQTEGAVRISITGIGSINCENAVYVIRPNLNTFPQVSLILPQSARPTNYTLVENTGDGTVASASLFLADGSVFAEAVEGLLIINELASAANQAVKGSFDFTASNGLSQVAVRGTFDFISAADADYC
jgi:hypothetical protein